MPRFTEDEILRSFAIPYVIHLETNGEKTIILLLLTSGGTLRWRSSKSGPILDIVREIEAKATTLKFEETTAHVAARELEFETDAAKMHMVPFPDDGSARAITQFRLGSVQGRMVVQIFTGDEVEQYLMDAVCVRKLVAAVRQAIVYPDDVVVAETIH